jgi:DNA-binding response OmpR family regulator
MDEGARRVLVVEQDRGLRDRVGKWLEDEGFDVMACSGPSTPEYACVAFRHGGCPLAHGADVVVLDVWTAADAVERGHGGLELLRYYTDRALPVIAVRQRRDPLEVEFDEAVADVEWPPDRDDVVETVRAVLRARPPGPRARRSLTDWAERP